MREPLHVQAVRDALLTPGSPWRAVDGYASVDSTNLEALRRPDPWRVVVADHQSSGRGRMTRQWEAPERASVAVSCVVPVPLDRAADWGWLPLLTGMAVRQALVEAGLVSARLKWPNDVLAQQPPSVAQDTPLPGRQRRVLGHRPTGGGPDAPWLKISGVLCQMVGTGGLVVAGAGVNVDQDRGELPVDTATSLRLCGVSGVRREDLVVGYLRALSALHGAWLGGGARLDGVRAAYRQACLTIGERVDVHQPSGGVSRGRAVAVDDLGRLVFDGPDGRVAHAAGDVVHVRGAGPP